MSPLRLAASVAILALMSAQLMAAPSTSLGQISVAQALETAEQAKTDAGAHTAIIAYLAAIGETAGILVAEAERRHADPLDCGRSFSLSEELAVKVLMAAVPDPANWVETAATPIIIADMFDRAGCR